MEPEMQHLVKLFGPRPSKGVVHRGGRTIGYGVLQGRWDQRANAIVKVYVGQYSDWGPISKAAMAVYQGYFGVLPAFVFYVTSTNVFKIKGENGELLTGPEIEEKMNFAINVAERLEDDDLVEDLVEAIFKATMGSVYGRLVTHASSGHIQGADMTPDAVYNHANIVIGRIQRVALSIARQQMDTKMLSFPKFLVPDTEQRAKELIEWIEENKGKKGFR